jgi:Zn-dependent peptidase ImmA (M78 family)
MDSVVPRRLTYDNIRKQALSFLQAYHPDESLPIPIEEIVELQLKINICPLPGLNGVIDTLAFISSDFKTITIDEHLYMKCEARMRFSLAHEIGHMVLHRGLFEGRNITCIDDYKGFQNAISEDDYMWIERQANSFAGCLLVPQKQLLEKVEEAERKHISYITGSPNPVFSQLPGIFNVSEDVMAIRLQKERLITNIVNRF